MYQVTKRDGKITDFHLKKIVAAITKAFEAQEKAIHPDIIDMLALKVTAEFEPKIQKNLHSGRRYTGQCGVCADSIGLRRCGERVYFVPQTT